MKKSLILIVVALFALSCNKTVPDGIIQLGCDDIYYTVHTYDDYNPHQKVSGFDEYKQCGSIQLPENSVVEIINLNNKDNTTFSTGDTVEMKQVLRFANDEIFSIVSKKITLNVNQIYLYKSNKEMKIKLECTEKSGGINIDIFTRPFVLDNSTTNTPK